MALDCADQPAQLLPIWSVAPPAVASTRPAAAAALDYQGRNVAGRPRLRARDLLFALAGVAGLCKVLFSFLYPTLTTQ